MSSRDEFRRRTFDALLARREPDGTWCGHLSSSALSTATACIALLTVDARRYCDETAAGIDWLTTNQNSDGGWGDTTQSRSNLATTWMGYCALTAWAGRGELSSVQQASRDAAVAWLVERLGGEQISPKALAGALGELYGKDRTFQVPLFVSGVISGALGDDAAILIPRLPFELAVFPHRVLRWLRLPVVSYALPALIAMGQWIQNARGGRFWRRWLVGPTRRTLRTIQPDSGGFLEAAPLTSFVTMAMADMGAVGDPAVVRGVAFLRSSQRDDGAWPIDENLSTWVTSLSASAVTEELPDDERAALVDSILDRQQCVVHPFTQATGGGWSWTNLSGGVPDADDTSAALLALDALLGKRDGRGTQTASQRNRVFDASRKGAAWLMGVQNSDGGFPTFCKGWGLLPFDQSCCDITAHAISALNEWHVRFADAAKFQGRFEARMIKAIRRGVKFLRAQQESDGRWVPLWFGNEQADGQANGVYGTARVLIGLARVRGFEKGECFAWLCFGLCSTRAH